MKKIILLLVLLGLFSQLQVRAERHIVRASWSDATPLLLADLFIDGLTNAVTGAESERDNFKGMFTLGYRYKLSRFAVGADISYANLSQRVRLPGEQYTSGEDFSVRESGDYIMVMPAMEYVYVKFPFVDFYTSMAAGYMYSKLNQQGLTTLGTSFLNNQQDSGTSFFCYQYNPVGIRAGVDKLAAFFELGFGYRGFINLGIDFRF